MDTAINLDDYLFYDKEFILSLIEDSTIYENLKSSSPDLSKTPLLDEENQIYLVTFDMALKRYLALVYSKNLDKFFGYYTSASGGFIWHLMINLNYMKDDKEHSWFYKTNYDYVTGMTIDFNISKKMNDLITKIYFRIPFFFEYDKYCEVLSNEKFELIKEKLNIFFKDRVLLSEDIGVTDKKILYSFEENICSDDEMRLSPYHEKLAIINSIYFNIPYKRKKINQLKTRCKIDNLSKNLKEKYNLISRTKLFDYTSKYGFNKWGTHITYYNVSEFKLKRKTDDISLPDCTNEITMYFLYYNGPKRTQYFQNIPDKKIDYSLCVYIMPSDAKTNYLGLKDKYLYSKNLVWKVMEYKDQTKLVTIPDSVRADSRYISNDELEYNFFGDLFTDIFPSSEKIIDSDIVPSKLSLEIIPSIETRPPSPGPTRRATERERPPDRTRAVAPNTTTMATRGRERERAAVTFRPRGRVVEESDVVPTIIPRGRNTLIAKDKTKETKYLMYGDDFYHLGKDQDLSLHHNPDILFKTKYLKYKKKYINLKNKLKKTT